MHRLSRHSALVFRSRQERPARYRRRRGATRLFGEPARPLRGIGRGIVGRGGSLLARTVIFRGRAAKSLAHVSELLEDHRSLVCMKLAVRPESGGEFRCARQLEIGGNGLQLVCVQLREGPQLLPDSLKAGYRMHRPESGLGHSVNHPQ